MRLALAGGAALIGGALYLAPGLGTPHDVYPGTPEAVYQTLDNMALVTGESGPLGAHPIDKHGDHRAAITWTGGARGAIGCTATLSPIGGAQTRVELRCTVAGAADPAAVARARIGMIEQIDATLRGRPYNPQAVAIAASAAAALGQLPAAPTDRAPAEAPAPPPPPPSPQPAGAPADPAPPTEPPPVLVIQPVG